MIKIEKQVVTDLSSCVLWALKFLKTPSGAGMWINTTARPAVVMRWEEKFMKALDGIGYHIIRKEFWKRKSEPKKVKKKVRRKDVRLEGVPT